MPYRPGLLLILTHPCSSPMSTPADLPQNYYDLLAISPYATLPEIRQAYRELSKQYHPDTTTLAPEVAISKFQQIQEAYATLVNPDQRRFYDLYRAYEAQVQSVAQATSPQPAPPRPPNPTPESYGDPQGATAGAGDRSAQPSAIETPSAYLDAIDRPLSPGEVFALFLLGVTFLACIVLALALGIARGELILD